ncbi:MAG: hydroxymethylbilane synthase, partial [Salinimicrobium sp.]
TAPIGALAVIKDGTINFHGTLFNLDGTRKFEVRKTVAISDRKNFGKTCAEEILKAGGAELMKEIKASINKQ